MNIRIINKESTRFYCTGDEALALGHPAASLILDSYKETAVCPYCSATYNYKAITQHYKS